MKVYMQARINSQRYLKRRKDMSKTRGSATGTDLEKAVAANDKNIAKKLKSKKKPYSFSSSKEEAFRSKKKRADGTNY